MSEIKRYTVFCKNKEWEGEREASSSDFLGAIKAVAYRHEEHEGCWSRVHDNVTGKDVEL